MSDEQIPEFSFGEEPEGDSKNRTYTKAELRNDKVFPSDKIREDICQVKKSMEDSVPLLKDLAEYSKEGVELARENVDDGQRLLMASNENTERIEVSNRGLVAKLDALPAQLADAVAAAVARSLAQR